MSVAEKVELVAGVRESYGLNKALAGVGLAKSSWYYHQQQKVSYSQKYAHLRPLLEEIIQAQPAYGSPRLTTELQVVYEQRVNHKVCRAGVTPAGLHRVGGGEWRRGAAYGG